MSQILNCGLSRETLSILITMIEKGANPEALVEFQMKNIINDKEIKMACIKSDEDNSQIYFSVCPQFTKELVEAKKGIVYYNENFVYALIGDKTLVDEKAFKAFLESVKCDLYCNT